MCLLVTNVIYQNLAAFLMSVFQDVGRGFPLVPMQPACRVHRSPLDGQTSSPYWQLLGGTMVWEETQPLSSPNPSSSFSPILLLKVTGFIRFWLLLLLLCVIDIIVLFLS